MLPSEIYNFCKGKFAAYKSGREQGPAGVSKYKPKILSQNSLLQEVLELYGVKMFMKAQIYLYRKKLTHGCNTSPQKSADIGLIF